MAYDAVVLPPLRVGLVVLGGHVTGAELVRACQDLVTRPAWAPGFDEVWDLTGAAEVDVSPGELKDLVVSAHEYRNRIGSSRVAFVTRRESLDVLLRLFGVLTADLDREYRCLDTREDAAGWLGLAPGALTELDVDGPAPTP
jgi:hypothetical protein